MGKYYLGTGNNNQINFQVVDSTGVINDLNLSGLYLSATGKALDADKLDNLDSSYFRNAANLTGVYTGQISGGGIGNADTLDNYDSSYFLNASNITGTLGLNATGLHYISGSLTVDNSTLFVDAVNDKVGIGTTVPAARLDIYHASSLNGFQQYGKDGVRFRSPGAFNEHGYIEYTSGGDKTVLGSFYSGGGFGQISLRQHSSTTTQDSLTLDNAGNVGIAGSLYADGNVGVGTFSTTSPWSRVLQVYNSNNSALSVKSAARDWQISTAADGKLNIYDNTASAHRLNIDTSGNVGIGTPSPGNKLTIIGSSNQLGIGDGTLRFDIGYDNSYLRFKNSAGDTHVVVNWSSGYVGIGTTSPSAKLHTVNTVDAAGPIFENTGGRGSITVKASSTNSAYVNFGNANGNSRAFIDFRESTGYLSLATSFSGGYITFNTDSQVEKMRITSAGNVGIGTTSPGAKLEVGVGTISGLEPNQYLRVNSSTYNSALSSNLDLLNWGNNFTNSLGWRISVVNQAGVTTPRDLTFSSLVDAGSGTIGAATERMRILSATGNVGIGTTSPTASGFSTGNPILDLTGTVPTLALHASGSTQQALIVSGGDGLILAASGAATATNNNVIRFYTEETNSQNTPTERVRIDSVGNVGIGTTSPSATLHVVGSSLLSTLYSSGSNTTSFTLGTDAWIKLATIPNYSYATIKGEIGSTNSEEAIEISIKTTHVTTLSSITVSRQSYNPRLLEVRVQGADGAAKIIYARVRTSDYAPTISWKILDVQGTPTIENTIETPVGAVYATLLVSGNASTQTNNTFSLSNTTASSSAVTGALQVAGGIGIGGASVFGSSVQIANAIISQSGNHAFITGPTTAGAFLTLQSGNTTGGINFRDSAGNSVGQYYQVTDAWSFAKPTTFAGAVTASSTAAGGFGQVSIANNIGAAINNYMLGSTYGGTIFGGVTGNNQAVIEASALASSLYLGTAGSSSIVLATNRTAALTLASGGAATFAGAVNLTTASANNTSQFTVSNANGTAKSHLGNFANSTYLATNYFYNGAQTTDDATQPSASLVLGNDRTFKFYSAAASATPANSLILTLDGSTSAATFAGDVITAGKIGATSGDSSTTTIQSGSSSGVKSSILLRDSWNGTNNNNAFFAVQLGNGSASADALRIDYLKNATFAGAVTINSGGLYSIGAASTFDANTVSTDLVLTLRTLTAGSASSRSTITNKAASGLIEFNSDVGSNGVGYGFDFKARGTSRFSIASTGDAAFAGAVTAATSLTAQTATITGTNSASSYPLTVKNNALKASASQYTGISIQTADASPVDLGLLYFTAASATDRTWRLGAFDTANSTWSKGSFPGAISIASTTAGSAGAGALVVTGGLATGAASYFGGGLTFAAATTSAGGIGFGTDMSLYRANSSTLVLKSTGTSSALAFINIGASSGSSINCAPSGLEIVSAGNIFIAANGPSVTITTGDGLPAGVFTAGLLTIDTISTTGAATFAGAVTAGGTIQVTANTTPSGGSGLEIQGGATPTLFAYNRTGSAYLPLIITGSTLSMKMNNVDAFTLTGASASASTATFAGAVTIAGNLTVNGTTTTVNSTTVTVDDPIITLGGDTVPTVDDNKDRGVEFRWHNGTVGKVGFFGFDDSTGYLTFIPDATNTSEIFSGSVGDIQAANFRGNLIGNVTGNVSGSAGSVATLTAGSFLTGGSFNGSAAVTFAVDATSANTASKVVARDASGNFSAGAVTASSLTSPAGIDLTLAGGSSGASLVLGQGSSGVPVFATTNAFSFGTHTTISTQTGVGNIPVFAFRNSSTTANNGAAIRYNSVDSGGSTYRTGAEAGTIFTARTASTLSGALYFATSNAGSFAERMRIAANGDVGIGRTSPTEKLHLYDGTTTSKPNIFLDSDYSWDDGNRGGVLWGIGGDVVAAIRSRQRSENIYALNFEVYNGMEGVPALASRMLLTGNGNLLIGTTAESGLTGAGGLRIGSYTAGSAGAGALVVLGGLSAGGASYFGGAVTVSLANPEVSIRSASDAAAQRQYLTFGSPTYNRAQFQSVSAGTSDGSLELRTFNAGSQTLSQTWNKDGSSTFAGAVTVGGQTIINAVGSAGSPTLRLNTSTSSTFVHAQEALAANLTAGQHVISVVGKSADTKNSGYIGYTWAGNASNSNYVTIGHWGADDLFRVYGDGTATVGANTVIHAGNYTSYFTAPGNGALTLAVSGTGLSGSASFSANQSGATTFTVASNATSANTASAIVARDASGNFSAGTITGTRLEARNSGTTQIWIDSTTSGSKEIAFQNNGSTVSYVWASGGYIAIGGGSTVNSLFVTPANGNVGIGTTAPGAKLEVASTNNTETVRMSLSTDLGFRNSFYNYFDGASPGLNWMALRVASAANTQTEAMRLLGNGNVGIGTTGPVGKLEVVTASDTAGTPSAYDNKYFTVGTGGATGGSVFISYDQTNNRGYIGALSPSVAWRNLILQGGGGNVGIGTASPNYKLDVSGTGYVSGALTSGGRIAATGAACELYLDSGASNSTITSYGSGVYKDLWIRTLSSSSNGVWIKATTGNVGIGQAAPDYKLEVETGVGDSNGIRVRDSATGVWMDLRRRYIECTGGDFWINSQSSSFDLRTANSSRLFIALGGNVGVGTSSPNQKFEVAGGAIIASGFGNRAAGTGKALEIGMDGTQGVLQAYDRSSSVYIPLAISATTTTFSGAVTSTGTLTTSSGRVVATSVKTTSYTLATTDYVIVCNHASTPFTITLIAASANTGRVFIVKNKGAATVTLSATSLGTIDGINTRDLSTNQSLILCSDGSQWNII